MAGIAEVTETVDSPKAESRRTATKIKGTAATPPAQARKRARAAPRQRPEATSCPQPPVTRPPRPAAEGPQPRTRGKTPPNRAAASLPRPGLAPPPEPAAEEPSAAPAPPVTQAQALQELVRRASAGNATCLAGLRKFLDDNPMLWQAAGDASALAERHWVALMADGNALAEEAIPRRLRAMKAELVGPDPTPLEKLLIDVIGVSWLAAQHGEVVAAQSGGSIEQANFRQKRAESIQRRLLRATKTLAMVRALSAKTITKRAKRK